MPNSGLGSPYWYEWEIGVLECLNLLTEDDIESVVLQSSDFQCLDDVVINYKDNSMINIQVKHTDIGDNFTYSFLSTGTDSLLYNLANEWEKAKEKSNIKKIVLVTNKKWGTRKTGEKCSMDDFVTKVYPKLQGDYNYISENSLEQNAIIWFKTQLDFLGDNAAAFVKCFQFCQKPGLAETDEMIRKKISDIIGTEKKEAVDSCMNGLMSMVRIWATSRRKKQEIYKEDIYSALCSSEPDAPQYELYPEKPIFPSRERFAINFISRIQKSDKKLFFLYGLPGAGKTNFISYLAQLENSVVDFRYYTYLPVNKNNASFSDDEGFYTGRLLWISILNQIRKKFEELHLLAEVKFPLIYRFLSVSEMRSIALEFMPIYAKQMNKTCYFFIDGIDHAARSHYSQDSFLLQIPQPNEIGEGIKIILVGQPINEKYPSWFVQNGEVEYFDLPTLSEDDICQIISINKIVTNQVDVKTLSNTIISVVGNNALNVIFAVQELKRMPLPLSYEIVEAKLKEQHLDGQINKYYEWILGSQEKTLLFYKIEAIFAFLSQKIKLEELAILCNSKNDDVHFVLSKLYPIIVFDDGYYAFHNDVRLFFRKEIGINSNYGPIAKSICDVVCDNDILGRFKYDLVYGLLLQLGNVETLLNHFDTKYIMESINYGLSINYLSRQLSNIFRMVVEKKSYEHLGKICVVAWAISQYANCIDYYEKKDELVEDHMPDSKTNSEKYVLDKDKSFLTIVEDIYELIKKNQVIRAEKLFEEYFRNCRISSLLVVDDKRDKKNTNYKLGYICRLLAPEVINEEVKNSTEYIEFVEGWFDAGVNLPEKKDIQTTFNVKYLNSSILGHFFDQILLQDNLHKEEYLFLDNICSHKMTPFHSVVDLCIYGIFHGYDVTNLVEKINADLEDILVDTTIDYDSDRLLVLVKTLFCVYEKRDERIKEIYSELLQRCRITTDKDRGYKPSRAQLEMAGKIFDLFYCTGNKEDIESETIFDFIYFQDKYGLGSCHDCNSYAIIGFLRSVFVSYAKNHRSSVCIKKVCEGMVQCLAWDKKRYIPEFNILFYYADEHEKFLEVVDYWCGYNGAIWKRDYSEMSSCCEGIICVLKLFEDYTIIHEIEKRLQIKLFGYIGHKDHSLVCLLEFYKHIPISEKKLLDDGMEMLSISDAASSIGDNRMSSDIEKELFDVASKLGVAYVNALFELKNTPSDFIRWRERCLHALYDMTNQLNEDKELLALHRITNAWINARIESDKDYGRKETLCAYNSVILHTIRDETMKTLVKQTGNIECYPTKEYDTSREQNCDYYINHLKAFGYTTSFEQIINDTIGTNKSGILNMLLRLLVEIPEKDLSSFANNCVINYIIKESKYGYLYTGLSELINAYSMFFNEKTWEIMLLDIASRVSNEETYCLGFDIGIYTLFYFKKHFQERIEEVFADLCRAHKLFITADGLLADTTYKLILEKSEMSIQEMADYQLNEFMQ